MAKIKLNDPKNIYGKRVEAGSVLVVDKDIPKWQAEKFLALGVAAEFVENKKKAAK